ncbi:lipopolysaccharide biosynthesis protein [Shewanella frigidimarina]|uniref:lipopolysaccharide biosynthesis protein n=1 Tax=Shewanella frigidimarina TaxID=56812 RepID=UPI003D78D7D2
MSVRPIIAAISGIAGAQLIGLIFVPLLTQLYSPETFGHVGFILAISAILLPISTLSFPVAIVLAKDETHAKQLNSLSLITALIVTLTTLVIILFCDWANLHLSDKSNANYLYFVPITVFFCACLQIADNWSIRQEAFSVRAKIAVTNSLLINSGKLLLGLVWATPVSLILVTMANPILNAILLIGSIAKNNRLSITSLFYLQYFDWRERVNEYRAFPLYNAPQVFLNALSKGAPVIILGIFFGPASAGWYGLSYTVLMAPVTLISKAIGDVFYSQIAKKNNKQVLTQSLIKYTVLLAIIGIIPSGILLLWGPNLFSLFFGEQWFQAGVYAKWLALWSFFIFINAPSLKAIIILKKQKAAMVINMITMPLRLLALLAGAYFYHSQKLALLGFVVIGITHNALIMLLAYRACKTQHLSRFLEASSE